MLSPMTPTDCIGSITANGLARKSQPCFQISYFFTTDYYALLGKPYISDFPCDFITLSYIKRLIDEENRLTELMQKC